MTLQRVADITVLVVIGVFLGMMIGDATSAEHYIREWQALIAGVLAVIAATWTVREMRRNEQRQQDRHDQVLANNEQAATAVMRRAARMHTVVRNALADIDRCIARHEAGDVHDGHKMEAIFTSVEFARIHQISAISDASKYFDPELSIKFSGIASVSQTMRENWELVKGDINSSANEQTTTTLYKVVIDQFGRLRGRIEAFANGLEALGEI